MDLKDLLSPETYAKVQKELEGKDVKFVNLKDGGYVSKDKYDAAEAKANEFSARLASATKDYESLKEKAGDNAELKKQLEALQKQSKDDTDRITKEYNSKLFNMALSGALSKAKARDPKDIIPNLDMSKITYKDEKFEGLDDQLEALRKNKGYLFEESRTSTGREHGQPLGDKDSDDELRKAFGLGKDN